jgi:hypothetical protein
MSNLYHLDLGMEILIGAVEVVGHYVDSSGINTFISNKGKYHFCKTFHFQN